ncbi:hypothetical protein ACFFF7_15075 [Novosphingobium aquiterrae]|uniref:Uncharacterized protein n=1 Tax=Novosphingobium aquiterrae TaxID=624388 RepID=A0ABV6PLL4_9SPHN
MTRTAIRPRFLRTAAVAALASALLAACGSASSGDQTAIAAASDTASEAATPDATAPANLAVAGPDGVTGDKPTTASRDAGGDHPQDAATDENGQPINAGPPQPTEEDVRRAVEEAESK